MIFLKLNPCFLRALFELCTSFQGKHLGGSPFFFVGMVLAKRKGAIARARKLLNEEVPLQFPF
jgi:hypothetical protein